MAHLHEPLTITFPNGFTVSLVKVDNPLGHIEYMILTPDGIAITDSTWIAPQDISDLLAKVSSK